MLHGGKRKADADPLTATAVVEPELSQLLSYLTVSLPFNWVATQPPGAFVRLVVELSDVLAPLHGHAGLAIIPTVGIRQSSPEMKWITGLMARFRGLQFDLPWYESYWLQREKGMKGVNWLTIVDQALVDQLGGDSSLRALLGEGIGWLPFRTGLVIQAGDRPLFGDVNVQELMTCYEQVARALKPIRARTIGSLSSSFGFDEARTDKWLARFD